MAELTLHLPSQTRPSRRRFELLTLLLIGLAVTQLVLLWDGPNYLSHASVLGGLPQHISATIAALILLAAARLHPPGPRRWAWRLHAAAMASSVVGLSLQSAMRWRGLPPVSPASELCYTLTYVLAILGSALYLPRQPGWLGSALQVVLESAAIGAAVAVMLLSVVPLHPVLQSWPPRMQLYLAADVGIGFTLGVLTARYFRSGGPLIWLSSLSMICLLLADLVVAILDLQPSLAHFSALFGPLYTLHRTALALAAFRSADVPPRFSVRHPTAMPFHEWLLWTIVPRGLGLLAVACALFGAPVPAGALVTLLLITLAREGSALIEQRRVYRELDRARERASEAAQATERFLAQIVHDQASPIQGLWSVQRQPGVFRLPEAEQRLTTHLEHLQRLFDQLQLYLHARSAGARLERRTLDALPVAQATLDAARGTAAARRVQLRLVLEVDETTIVADETALRRVLDNLLSNALQATPPGGQVLVQLSAPGDGVDELLIAVQDSGEGLSEAQRQRVFEPLVRFRQGQGLGLGLAIVRDLVAAMGGAVGVESRPGAGSTFWVRLPTGAATRSSPHQQL